MGASDVSSRFIVYLEKPPKLFASVFFILKQKVYYLYLKFDHLVRKCNQVNKYSNVRKINIFFVFCVHN